MKLHAQDLKNSELEYAEPGDVTDPMRDEGGTAHILVYVGRITGEPRRWTRTDVVLFSFASDPSVVWGVFSEHALTEQQEADGIMSHRAGDYCEARRYEPRTVQTVIWELVK